MQVSTAQANEYYFEIYNEIEASDYERWRLSTQALAAVVLLIPDWSWDGRDSVALSTYGFIDDRLAHWMAMLCAIAVAGLLVWLIFGPILGDESRWVYCPGFPDSPANNLVETKPDPADH